MPEPHPTRDPDPSKRYSPELLRAIREGEIIDEAEFGLIPPERQRPVIAAHARITFLA